MQHQPERAARQQHVILGERDSDCGRPKSVRFVPLSTRSTSPPGPSNRWIVAEASSVVKLSVGVSFSRDLVLLGVDRARRFRARTAGFEEDAAADPERRNARHVGRRRRTSRAHSRPVRRCRSGRSCPSKTCQWICAFEPPEIGILLGIEQFVEPAADRRGRTCPSTS